MLCFALASARLTLAVLCLTLASVRYTFTMRFCAVETTSLAPPAKAGVVVPFPVKSD